MCTKLKEKKKYIYIPKNNMIFFLFERVLDLERITMINIATPHKPMKTHQGKLVLRVKMETKFN